MFLYVVVRFQCVCSMVSYVRALVYGSDLVGRGFIFNICNRFHGEGVITWLKLAC